MNTKLNFTRGYADVNGLKMYYEIYGEGKPLVLIHGGGSTIETSFGRIIPLMAKNRKLIGVELQTHGHTNDRDNDISFARDAEDVVELLSILGITRADFLGFSNGANTTLHIAIHYPEIVNKIIVASAFFKRDGAFPQFFDFMQNATIGHMPQEYKDIYLKVAPDPNNLQTMHDKCVKRMIEFSDVSDADIMSVNADTLIIIGDQDVVTPEHAVVMFRLIKNSRLAIIPGAHGAYIGEITTLKKPYTNEVFAVPLIEEFLDSISK